MIPEGYEDIVKKIYEYEKDKIDEYKQTEKEHGYKPGWEWCDVGVFPIKLMKLVESGILEVVYKSSSHTNYRLADFDTIQKYFMAKSIITKPQKSEVNPDDLFKYIVGYDDVKQLLRSVLSIQKPVHILMIGPPATGKTLFLEDIYNAYPDAEFIIGSEATSIGLSKLIREKRPSILLIDEIDKILKGEDLSTLLSVMESGKTRRVKGNNITDMIEVNIKVIAAGNTDKHLPPELKDRFFPPLYLKPYTHQQFVDVVVGYLTNFEDTTEDVAKYIADKVWNLDKSVRTARGLARMCKKIDNIDDIINVFRRYSRE